MKEEKNFSKNFDTISCIVVVGMTYKKYVGVIFFNPGCAKKPQKDIRENNLLLRATSDFRIILNSY